jgi:hypothetical protein
VRTKQLRILKKTRAKQLGAQKNRKMRAQQLRTVEKIRTAQFQTKQLLPHQLPPVLPAVSGGQLPTPGLSTQQVRGSEPVRNPAKKERFWFLVLAASVLAAVLIGALFGTNRDATATDIVTWLSVGTLFLVGILVVTGSILREREVNSSGGVGRGRTARRIAAATLLAAFLVLATTVVRVVLLAA